MKTTNTIDTTYRTLDQLGPDEKFYALDRIRRSPMWNNYLRDKINEKMFEKLESSGLYPISPRKPLPLGMGMNRRVGRDFFTKTFL